MARSTRLLRGKIDSLGMLIKNGDPDQEYDPDQEHTMLIKNIFQGCHDADQEYIFYMGSETLLSTSFSYILPIT